MKKTKKEKRIIYFVCLVLALIIAFSVGIIISRNSHYIKTPTEQASQESTEKQTQSTTKDTEDKIAESESIDNTTNSNKVETTKNTITSNNATNNTTITNATVIQTTAVFEPGTINNPFIISIDPDLWHLTLVNSSYRIPDTYSPDLVKVCGTEESLDRRIALEYEKMYAAALEDGVYLKPCSGYRSYSLQEKNYKNKVKFFEKQGYSTEDAKVKAATIIMPPGSSEHNLGYAMDIVCVEEWFENTKEFQWLTENAADYGFIMRYPKEKQHITKVIYEPWHWRYVGVAAAKEMKAKNLTLEEYLGVY